MREKSEARMAAFTSSPSGGGGARGIEGEVGGGRWVETRLGNVVLSTW